MEAMSVVGILRRSTIFIMALTLLVWGCSGAGVSTGDDPGNGDETAPDDEIEADAIRIGAILSQSGYAAWLGDTQTQAIQLLADRINEEGGIDGAPIEIRFVDDQSDPEQAISAANRLIREGVVAVIGPSLTPTTLAVEPIFEDAEIPMISMSGGYQPNSADSPWGWTVVIGALPAIISSFEWAGSQGFTTVGSITPTDPLGEAGDRGLGFLLEGEGAFSQTFEWVGHEKFNLEDINVRPQLSNLNRAGAEFVFAGVSGEAIVSIRRQMDEIGMEGIPLATYHSNTTPQVIDLMAGISGSLVMPGTAINVWDSLPPGALRDETESFALAYEQQYGDVAMSTEGFGYDGLKVIVEAMRAVGPDGHAIRDWLDAGQEIIGINYVMNFSEDARVPGTHESLIMMQVDPERGWVLLN